MTIRDQDMNRRLERLERCAEKAPEGTYGTAKDIIATLDLIMDEIMGRCQRAGFKASGTDHARNLHVELYRYFIESNSQIAMADTLTVSEGFGEHVDGPAGDRVLAQAVRDLAALRSLQAR